MSKMNQDEIQRLAEQGSDNAPDAETEKDIKAYLALFELLDQGPKAELSYSFTVKLQRRIQAAVDRRIGFKWYGIAAAMAVIGFGFAYCLLFLYNAHAATGVAGVIEKYKWVLLFVFAGFLIIQCVENYLNGRQRRHVL